MKHTKGIFYIPQVGINFCFSIAYKTKIISTSVFTTPYFTLDLYNSQKLCQKLKYNTIAFHNSSHGNHMCFFI